MKFYTRLPAQVPASVPKDFPAGNERQERKSAVPDQEDVKDRGESGRMQPIARESGRKRVQCSTPRGTQKAMVQKEVRAQCCVVRVAKRREGLGL